MKKPKLNYQNNKLKQQAIKEAEQESKLRHDVFDVYDWTEMFVDRMKDQWFNDKEFKGDVGEYIKAKASEFNNYVKEGRLSQEEYDEFMKLIDLHSISEAGYTNPVKTRRIGQPIKTEPRYATIGEGDYRTAKYEQDPTTKDYYELEQYQDEEILKANAIQRQKAQEAKKTLEGFVANRKPKGNA